jgi:NitT/TauT family transport system substrate-binding protein
MLKEKILKSLAAGFAFILLLQGCTSCNTQSNQKDEITLADASVVWWMAPGIIARKNNLYEKNGLSVKSFDVQTGLASKNAVLSGSADIGLVATSPLATGAFTKENLIVLASYVDSNSLLATITPKDNKEFSKPVPIVATVKGTISEIYFYKYINKYVEDENERKALMSSQLNVKPPDITNTIKNGNAKSAVIWEPFATMLASSDPNLKLNRSEIIYTHRIYIVTTPEVLQKKRSAVEKFVKTFEEASNFIKTNPDDAKKIILSGFDNQADSMNNLWKVEMFEVKYDYDKMKSLIAEDAEILSELGLTPKDDSGNFRKLKPEDIQYLFNHDFKLSQAAGNSK